MAKSFMIPTYDRVDEDGNPLHCDMINTIEILAVSADFETLGEGNMRLELVTRTSHIPEATRIHIVEDGRVIRELPGDRATYDALRCMLEELPSHIPAADVYDALIETYSEKQ